MVTSKQNNKHFSSSVEVCLVFLRDDESKMQLTALLLFGILFIVCPARCFYRIPRSRRSRVPQAPPSNVTAEPQSTTSIRVSWGQISRDKRGGIITQYLIELYNSSGKVGLDHIASGNLSSYVVQDLKVFSRYSVRIRAKTAEGKGPFSGYYNVTTHCPAPQGVPKNVKAAATGTSTIRVRWDKLDAPSDIGFLGYRIKYETVELVHKHKGIVTVDKDNSSKILTNLAIFKQYKIQVAARTTQDGNYSEPVFVTTLEGVPTAPPGDPHAEILDSTSARIKWGSVPEENHNGIIKGYRVFFKRIGNGPYNVIEIVDGTYTLLLKSLEKAAEYQIKVLAFTKAGNGRAYNFTFQTSDDSEEYGGRKSDLIAIIEGGAEVIRGHNENITINASLSYDPDVGPGDHSHMNFTWHFGEIKGNYSKQESLYKNTFTGPNRITVQYLFHEGYGSVVIFDTTRWSINNTYLVKLVVTKDYRNSSFFQVIRLVNGDPPKISQRCLINCGFPMSPSVQLSIQSQCHGSQCSKIYSYKWVLYEQIQLPPKTDTTWKKSKDLQLIANTPPNSSGIVIKKNSLDGGSNYRLVLFVQTTDGLPGMCTHDISAASPPTRGTCMITPSGGISLQTNFNLSCIDWFSHVTPQTYHFQYQLDNGLYSTLYHGLNNSIISWLPPGNGSDNYKVQFRITVVDKYGAFAPPVNISVQVKPSHNPENINSFLTANYSLFNQAIKDGNLRKVAQIANAVLQEVSKHSTLNSAKKTKIQDFIIEKIVKLQVKNLPELLQMSSVIGSAIQDTDSVSFKSLKNSLRSIDGMASLLWNVTQLKDVADIPLITQSAVNLGSCLNSVLKGGALMALEKLTSGPDHQQQAKRLVTRSMKIINTIGDAVLDLKILDEKMTSIKTTDSQLVMTLGRHTPAKLAGFTIEGGHGRFVLPAVKETLKFSFSETRFVDTQMLSISFTPFTWDDTRKRVDSDVLVLDLKDDKRKLINVANLSKDIEIVIPLKYQQISLQIPQYTYFTAKDNLRFHRIDVEYENTLINLVITPKDRSVSLFVYMRYGQRPSIQVHDLNATVSLKETCIWTSSHNKTGGKVECSSNGLTPFAIETVARQPGKYFLGVQSHNTSMRFLKRQKRSCFLEDKRQKRSCVQVKDPPLTPPQRENVSMVPVYDPNTSRNYTLKVALGSCVYWSEEHQKWTTEGCRVVSATLNGFVKCSCNHLTSFGGSFFVKPNPIDFDQVLIEFKQLSDDGNSAVIVTVAIVILCYFIALVIVRKADKADARYNGLPVELPATSSNLVNEYEVIITTGVWRNSGTTANVAMEICGAEESTGIIQLGGMELGPEYPLFSRGNTDIFVVKVDKPLGVIHRVQVGHDNAGESPSWFLEDIVVFEKQTNRSWTFTNSQWLALERADGRIERMLEMEQDKSNAVNEVLKRFWKDLTKKHTWVSVVAKPRRDQFTRVQRASCCLLVLLTAMFVNAMFYKIEGKYEHVIQIGPLKLSWKQVVIGIESALIGAPVNILVAFLFEKGAKNTESRSHCCSKAKWLTYLAWFLCFCSCAVSATLTIFYSLIWGKEISEQWLSSMFISFTQDVVITEPVQVFFTAIFLAVIIRRKKSRQVDCTGLEEAKNNKAKGRLWAMKLSEVEEMRRCQARKQNISRYFAEVFVYLVFVFLLMMVCYGNKNDHSYMMAKSIRDGVPKFEEVFNKKQYWSWVKNIFLPGVFAGKWYNGQQENQTMYIGNKRSVLVGMARGRQLRVKPKPCDILDNMKHLFPVCYGGYSSSNEDRTLFNKLGWKPADNSTNRAELFRLCPKPWRYQDAEETDTVPKWGQFSLYPGGGFVADIGYENVTGSSIIEALKNDAWIDRQTRAIILEFSAFNPTVNLLGVSTYFFEIEDSGYSAPFTRINIIPLDSTDTGSKQFYLICILFFIIFVVMYLGRECYRLHKQRSRYFKSFWNWVEIFQVIFSAIAVVMYIVRSDRAASTIQELQKNIYMNVSFQEVIIWLEAENAVLGILTFIVTAKLLRLMRFNQHVAVFSKTLKTSALLLSSFSVILLIGFVAFLHFGILVFGTGSKRYSSVLRATYFQLELTLGRVKARSINELADTNVTFGRIFAALLLFCLTIMAMNFFIAILNDALIIAKTSTSESKLYDLVDEDWRLGAEEKKNFFDAISRSIREMKVSEKTAKSRERRIRNIDVNSSKRVVALVNCDQTSKISKKNEELLSKQKRVRFSEDVIKLQLRKLRTKKKYLYHRLDDIMQVHDEEEETFRLLCYEIAAFSQHTTINVPGSLNESST